MEWISVHTYEEMVSVVKKLAEEIANLHIDKALLRAELETAKAKVEELEKELQKELTK